MIRVCEDHGVVAIDVAGDVVVVVAAAAVDDGGGDGGGIACQAMDGDNLSVHTYSVVEKQSAVGLGAPVQDDHILDDDMKDETRMRGRMNLGSTGPEE